MTATRRRRAARWFADAIAGWWAIGLATALVATAPHNVAIPAANELAGRQVEDVALTADDGVLVRGWYVEPAAPARAAVVLAAGIHGNRLSMRDRAAFYLRHGVATLLVDLRGTGASAPERVAMGLRESRDLVAWRRWLEARGHRVVGAHGCSLGAAAIVYAANAPWDFAVLESCYRNLDAALAARLPFVPWPRVAFWPLRCCAEWLLDCAWSDFAPERAITALHAPVLFVAGDRDVKIGPDATAVLHANCPSTNKSVLVLPGLGHEDLWPSSASAICAAIERLLP